MCSAKNTFIIDGDAIYKCVYDQYDFIYINLQYQHLLVISVQFVTSSDHSQPYFNYYIIGMDRKTIYPCMSTFGIERSSGNSHSPLNVG